MGENSKIAWTDHTFNPWTGCTKISPGCAHCYAETWSKRSGLVIWGDGGTRKRTSAANWKEPFKWNRQAEKEGVRRKVFTCSLADFLEDREELIPWRMDACKVMESTPWLDWLLLTKRPENHRKLPYKWFPGWPDSEGWPPNIWFGFTAENQEYFDARVTHALEVPAPVHFVSCEPLLERITLRPYLGNDGIDWVIVGGESGPKARDFHVEYAFDLLQQCRDSGAAPFIKQLGAKPVDYRGWPIVYMPRLNDPAGADPSEWPERLRVQEFPR